MVLIILFDYKNIENQYLFIISWMIKNKNKKKFIDKSNWNLNQNILLNHVCT